MLEGIGDEGIEKLRSGRVFILGCGALGSLCAMYLAGSGVGTITLADFDSIDISNLQRQLFFNELELGLHKAETLASKIRAINSDIKVDVIPEFITPSKAKQLLIGHDFVVDGSDNPSTKKMTSSVCEELNIPYCIGGVREFCGQVMSWAPGYSGYCELFGDVPQCSGFTPCSIGGVLGPAAGVVASVQASEVIKHLTGVGEMLYDRLFTFDLRNNQTSVLGF